VKLILGPELAEQLGLLYQEMETVYDQVAGQLGLTCSGCPDNCCDSYFMHHTYIEWSYLWHGLSELPTGQQKEIIGRAEAYEKACEAALAAGDRPQVMCPLNESGRCILYKHRLMVCRTHGVTAAMTRPDGKRLQFPGCFRCQDIVEKNYADVHQVPEMDRTGLLRQLVVLEQQCLSGRRHMAPRVKMTIAAMLISGPPSLADCSDRRAVA
jgi:hypothetical protein